MREIKFRGQDFETGKWIYGSYNGVHAGVADVFIIYEKEIFDPVSFGFIGTEIVEKEVKEETVGQYTGLKDKNGVEVYDGDIVALSEEFDEDRLYAIEWQVNGYWLDGWDGNEYGFPGGSNLEVVGNIYENPELLENNDSK